MKIITSLLNTKYIVFFCLAYLLVALSVQAAMFRPCNSIDYKIDIERVDTSVNDESREVSVTYTAKPEINISGGQIKVDTFTYIKESMEEEEEEAAQITHSHSFCEDTGIHCPVKRGSRFTANFIMYTGVSRRGTQQSFLMRLVDEFKGTEFGCVVVDVDTKGVPAAHDEM